MAGGKETPRQKMIGMMYLVLTALLALNVSNAVLEKFAILNTTLAELRDEEEMNNEKKNNNIQGATSKAAKVEAAKKKALEVREITLKALKDLDGVKEELSKGHDGVKMEGEELILNTNIPEEKMLSSTDPTKGSNFEKILVDYVTKLNDITKLQFKKLNKKAEDYEEFKDNEHHKEKDFLHWTFEGTPAIAAITVMTQLQTEMLEYEAIALDTLANIAEAVNLKADQIIPMVIPESKTVAAGAKYSGKMFIAASQSGLTPVMKRNGQLLAVDLDQGTGIKMGKVEFTASASSYGPGDISKQTFLAEITVKDTTYKMPIEYFVVKPVIKITTGNRPTLYRDCGNLVNIEVPSLGTNYNPTYTAKGATIVAGTKPSQPIIIPKEKKVEITVSSGGAVLGTEPFDVKPIPKPRYNVKNAGGKEIDLKVGERIMNLSSIRVSAEAEENFKQEVPKDASYRVRQVEVTLARGVQPVQKNTFTSENVDLSAWRNQMKAGDILLVNILQATRRTFEGQDEKQDIKSDGVIIVKVTN